MSLYRIACPCHFGLESVLRFEVGRIGAEDIIVTDGRVTFSGDEEVIAKANICLSTAERVLIQLAQFKAYSFEDLYQGVKAVDWDAFIGKTDAFPVKGHSLNSKLHSIPDCQSIIKKAVVDKLNSVYKVGFFEETGSVHQITFNIMKDEVTINLDTTGAGLHKRGYRKNSNAAPIRETLAAGIIDLAKVRSDTQLVDPFCGSGTFLIEGAYKAMRIAPGARRRFSAEHWDCFSEQTWRNARKFALDNINHESKFSAKGFDYDDEAVYLSLENSRKAGVEKRISVKNADIKNFKAEKGTTIICNPPYGERMLELKEAEELYRVMGKVFPANADTPCYIISPHEDFESFFGRKADKRRKLYNGMIKCQLFMYFK